MANEHSPRFEKVKYYYDHKMWSLARVKQAVVCGWITAEEYEEIVGEPYPTEGE